MKFPLILALTLSSLGKGWLCLPCGFRAHQCMCAHTHTYTHTHTRTVTVWEHNTCPDYWSIINTFRLDCFESWWLWLHTDNLYTSYTDILSQSHTDILYDILYSKGIVIIRGYLVVNTVLKSMLIWMAEWSCMPFHANTTCMTKLSCVNPEVSIPLWHITRFRWTNDTSRSYAMASDTLHHDAFSMSWKEGFVNTCLSFIHNNARVVGFAVPKINVTQFFHTCVTATLHINYWFGREKCYIGTGKFCNEYDGNYNTLDSYNIYTR